MKKHNAARPQGRPKKRAQAAQNAASRPRAPAGSTGVSSQRRSVARAAETAAAMRTAGPTGGAARARGCAQTQALARRDDRIALALLLAPFLIVAFSLGAERSLRTLVSPPPGLTVASREAPMPAPTVRPQVVEPGLPSLAPLIERPLSSLGTPMAGPLPTLATLIAPPLPALETLMVPALPELATLVAPLLPELATLVAPPLSALETLLAPALPELATLVAPALPALDTLVAPPLPELATLVAPPLPALARLKLPALPAPLCHAESGALQPRPASVSALGALPPSDPIAFGRALSAAALAQVGTLVIYNPKYQRIAYPLGDVPSLFGVCTDVVVRAYRAVGLDLQALVHTARVGSGDRNIDHRRVEVIRRFLTRHGRSLPVSDLSEDYQPGDIVTYFRPQNRATTAHIAIVTDQIAPSGRPMIVHNRGWGPQLEDALFVDKITGHYRYSGATVASPSEAARPKRLARR